MEGELEREQIGERLNEIVAVLSSQQGARNKITKVQKCNILEA